MVYPSDGGWRGHSAPQLWSWAVPELISSSAGFHLDTALSALLECREGEDETLTAMVKMSFSSCYSKEASK